MTLNDHTNMKTIKVENGGKSGKLVSLCQRSARNSVLGTGG